MGLTAWLDLKSRDIAAFAISSILGFLVGTILPVGPWAVYVPVLVSYHLFLAWLVITAEHETGVSMPIVSTIATHLACMAVIALLGMGHNGIPLFGLLKYAIAGLALFERGWLFVKTTPQGSAFACTRACRYVHGRRLPRMDASSRPAKTFVHAARDLNEGGV
jgi:hypothetical protein